MLFKSLLTRHRLRLVKCEHNASDSKRDTDTTLILPTKRSLSQPRSSCLYSCTHLKMKPNTAAPGENCILCCIFKPNISRGCSFVDVFHFLCTPAATPAFPTHPNKQSAQYLCFVIKGVPDFR